MKSSKTNSAFKIIANIFIRFNVTIFIVSLAGGLLIAVMVLTNIMKAPDSDLLNLGGSAGQSSFDDATIERLNKLGTSDDTSQNLPTGRINPFAG